MIAVTGTNRSITNTLFQRDDTCEPGRTGSIDHVSALLVGSRSFDNDEFDMDVGDPDSFEDLDDFDEDVSEDYEIDFDEFSDDVADDFFTDQQDFIYDRDQDDWN
jgi:hypothetical protein